MGEMFTLIKVKKQQKKVEKIKKNNKKLNCPKVDTDKAMKKLKKTMKE
jgi:hypothetical protein